jgi:hypothetical protein
VTAPLALVRQNGRARARQRRGDEAERMVDAHHMRPDWRAVAVLGRRYTPRASSGALLAPQGPDFSGHTRHGRHVEVELKAEAESLRLRELREASSSALEACANAGGVSVLLVLLGPHLLTADWCAVPWGTVARRISFGHKSIGRAELLGWRVPRTRHYLTAPWLELGGAP